jgi:hypothetical protein
MDNANRGNFESFGSMSGLHFLTPVNDFVLKGRSSVPIPCAVDLSLDRMHDIPSIGRVANYYERTRQERGGTGFKPVEVSNGEIPPNTIDDTSLQQSRFAIKVTNDARIIETTHPYRDVIRYRFPTRGMIPVADGGDHKRMFLAWLGLISNGDRLPSEGYLISPSLQVFRPLTVRYFTNRFDETLVQKSSSATSGPQTPKGTAGMTGGEGKIESEHNTGDVPPPGYSPPEQPRNVVPDSTPGDDTPLAPSDKGAGNQRANNSSVNSKKGGTA